MSVYKPSYGAPPVSMAGHAVPIGRFSGKSGSGDIWAMQADSGYWAVVHLSRGEVYSYRWEELMASPYSGADNPLLDEVFQTVGKMNIYQILAIVPYAVTYR